MPDYSNITRIQNIRDFNVHLDQLPLIGLQCRLCKRAKVDPTFNRFLHVETVRNLFTKRQVVALLKERFDVQLKIDMLTVHYKKHLDRDMSWMYTNKFNVIQYLNGKRDKKPVVVNDATPEEIQKVNEDIQAKKDEMDTVEKKIQEEDAKMLDDASLIRDMQILYFDLKRKYRVFDQSQNGVMTKENMYFYEKVTSGLRLILSELNKIQQSQKMVKGVIEIVFTNMAKVVAKEVINVLIETGMPKDKIEKAQYSLTAAMEGAVDLVLKDVGKTYSVH